MEISQLTGREFEMAKPLRCPTCNKPLTQEEYDKAMRVDKQKKAHIKHMEIEIKELAKEKRNYKIKELEFKKNELKQRKEFDKRIIAERKSAKKENQQLLKDKFAQGEKIGATKYAKSIKKQERELNKRNAVINNQGKSIGLLVKKNEAFSKENQKLKEQIDKGTTSQSEGFLEEDKLLLKLKELFPKDRFNEKTDKNIGKAGDIIHHVIEQGNEIGIILYECKKVKTFNKNFIEQTKKARNIRGADFAVLVTNVFPSKKQHYFVDKNVFVISPISLEPVVYTLRESLVRMSLLKLTNAAKVKAVQKIYEYLSSNDYSNRVNDISIHFTDLEKEYINEIETHNRTWKKRKQIYIEIASDIDNINSKLTALVRNIDHNQKFLPENNKILIEFNNRL